MGNCFFVDVAFVFWVDYSGNLRGTVMKLYQSMVLMCVVVLSMGTAVSKDGANVRHYTDDPMAQGNNVVKIDKSKPYGKDSFGVGGGYSGASYSGSYSSSSKSKARSSERKSVRVREYYRQDGTFVGEHMRSAPRR